MGTSLRGKIELGESLMKVPLYCFKANLGQGAHDVPSSSMAQ